MASRLLSDFLQRLCRAVALRGAMEGTDAELLERFVTRREEAAFEALVRRHGPMVLGVCRHLLPDAHDVEDAFQATFLVLVRRAASIQKRGLLSNWLYGVAYRIAVRARANAARRRAHERQGVEMAAAQPSSEPAGHDLRPVLHEELNRLPVKYQAPIVLCYLQGKTHEEAAQQLAWPIGTVKGRLVRARKLLRVRLTRRGLALSTGVVAATLAQAMAPAAVPVALVSSTVKAAMLIAAGQAAIAGVMSAQVAALTKGMLRTMFLNKLAIVCTVLLGMGMIGTGAGLFLYHSPGAEPEEGKKEAPSQPVVQGPGEPEKDAAKEAEDRRQSVANLKELANAMHDYHSTYGHFPPAAVAGQDGKPLLSWRVLLLPHLKEGKLFKEFKLDEPWDGPQNKKLLAQMPRVYAPVRGKGKEPHATYYQVFTGNGTIFEGTRAARITDIADGTSNTILLVEAAEAVPWTKPVDLPYDAQKPLPKLGGMFQRGFHFTLADGSVHLGKRVFDEQIMRRAIRRSDGEVLDLSQLIADK